MTEFYNADAIDIDLMVQHLDEVDRDEAERMRMLMWASLAPYSKKQLSPEEVMTFSWEKQGKATKATTTREDFERAFKNYLPNKQ